MTGSVQVTEQSGTRRASSGSVWEPVVGYSRAVAAGDFVFVAGCTSIDGALFVHPDDAVIHRELWEKARTIGQPFEQEMRLLRKDGVYRWFHARSLPFRSGGWLFRSVAHNL